MFTGGMFMGALTALFAVSFLLVLYTLLSDHFDAEDKKTATQFLIGVALVTTIGALIGSMF